MLKVYARCAELLTCAPCIDGTACAAALHGWSSDATAFPALDLQGTAAKSTVAATSFGVEDGGSYAGSPDHFKKLKEQATAMSKRKRAPASLPKGARPKTQWGGEGGGGGGDGAQNRLIAQWDDAAAVPKMAALNTNPHFYPGQHFAAREIGGGNGPGQQAASAVVSGATAGAAAALRGASPQLPPGPGRTVLHTGKFQCPVCRAINTELGPIFIAVNSVCSICHEIDIDCVFKDCGHVVACTRCALQLQVSATALADEAGAEAARKESAPFIYERPVRLQRDDSYEYAVEYVTRQLFRSVNVLEGTDGVHRVGSHAWTAQPIGGAFRDGGLLGLLAA